MSKVVFAVRAHLVTPGTQIVDVIMDNRLLCTISPGDGQGTGIRILTKHAITVDHTVGEGFREAPDVVMIKPVEWPAKECRHCGYSARDRGNGSTADYWHHMGTVHKVSPGVIPDQN